MASAAVGGSHIVSSTRWWFYRSLLLLVIWPMFLNIHFSVLELNISSTLVKTFLVEGYAEKENSF